MNFVSLSEPLRTFNKGDMFSAHQRHFAQVSRNFEKGSVKASRVPSTRSWPSVTGALGSRLLQLCAGMAAAERAVAALYNSSWYQDYLDQQDDAPGILLSAFSMAIFGPWVCLPQSLGLSAGVGAESFHCRVSWQLIGSACFMSSMPASHHASSQSPGLAFRMPAPLGRFCQWSSHSTPPEQNAALFGEAGCSASNFRWPGQRGHRRGDGSDTGIEFLGGGSWLGTAGRTLVPDRVRAWTSVRARRDSTSSLGGPSR